MTILRTLCWATVRNASFTDMVAAAVAGRFTAISIHPPMYFSARASGMSDAELVTRLDDAGVVIAFLDPLITVLPAVPQSSEVPSIFRALFEIDEDQAYEVASNLHIPSINVVHFLGARVERPRIVDAFGQFCSRAAKQGLQVLLEFLPEGSVPDYPAAADIVRQVSTGNAGVMFDTWHYFRTTSDPTDLSAIDPSDVGAMQVSDASADIRRAGTNAPLNGRLLPGTGELGFRELLQHVRAVERDLAVGVEVLNSELALLPPAEVGLRAGDALTQVISSLDVAQA